MKKRPKFIVHVRLRENAVNPESIYHWTLVAANGETLATSETFPDRASCQKSVRAARIAALGRTVEK